MFSENEYVCCFGEVLWDLFPTGKLAGGAPMNVANQLRNIGIESVMISRVGKDELGDEIKAYWASNHAPLEWIQTDDAHTTGIVKVNLSDKNEATYEIVHPVAWDFIGLTLELVDLVQGAYAIVFGTLACRDVMSRDTLFKLLEYAKRKVYDVNLRAPHYTQELIESLMQKADIVKMNDDELKIIASWHGSPDETDQEKMTRLREAYGLEVLIVTQGGDGAMLLNETGFYKGHGYKVTVADTVGSGDAFLAGFLKCLFLGKTSREALDYASALGALVATHHGANPRIEEREIFDMINDR